MKNKTIQFAAFVGIDWADQKHDVSTAPANDDSNPVHQIITHTPDALNEWVRQLRHQYPEGQIAVCLEQSKGALIYHLLRYDFLTLFPVNPKNLARFRQSFTTSGAKSDFGDSGHLREYVAIHHKRLRIWKPDDEQTRTISFFVEGRRKTVSDRTRLTNRLCSTLKMYFPQALKLAGETLHAKMALDFISKWPQLQDVQRAQSNNVQNFYATHNSRSLELIQERLTLIKSTIPLTKDQAVIKSSLITVKMLVAQITQLNSTIDEFDLGIKSLYDNHPDKDTFDSFPGSGTALGPRILSAWGTDRDRYEAADSMHKYSGIGPVTIASGKSKIVVRRLACPKFLLQTFHEFANCSRQSSVWAQAYYEMLRERGKSHHMAVRSLAFKWIRIMYRCWQDHTKYDEVKYLQALKKSNSPLLAFI
jgi:transposase